MRLESLWRSRLGFWAGAFVTEPIHGAMRTFAFNIHFLSSFLFISYAVHFESSWCFMYSCLKRWLFIRVSLATSYTHKKQKSHKRWWQSLMHDTEASKTNTERYFLFHGLAIFVIPSCSPRLLDRKTSIFLSLFDLLQFIQFYKLCSQNVPWQPLAESVWLLGRSLCHKEAKRMNKQSKKFQKNALKRQAQSYLSIPPTWLSLGTWNLNAQEIEWLNNSQVVISADVLHFPWKILKLS